MEQATSDDKVPKLIAGACQVVALLGGPMGSATFSDLSLKWVPECSDSRRTGFWLASCSSNLLLRFQTVAFIEKMVAVPCSNTRLHVPT